MIELQIKEIIADKLSIDINSIKNTDSLVEDLGADSLDTVELVMSFEERFGCEIPDEDAEKIITVQDAVDYISVRIV